MLLRQEVSGCTISRLSTSQQEDDGPVFAIGRGVNLCGPPAVCGPDRLSALPSYCRRCSGVPCLFLAPLRELECTADGLSNTIHLLLFFTPLPSV